MPYGDKTGPAGAGPMTGRGLGDCATGATGSSFRQGFGARGCGFGRGKFGNRRAGAFSSDVNVAPQNELQNLRTQVEILTKKIDDLQK